jgi:hypothetical protein
VVQRKNKCVFGYTTTGDSSNFYSMSHQVFWFSRQVAKISDEAKKKCHLFCTKKGTYQKELFDMSHGNVTYRICAHSDGHRQHSLFTIMNDHQFQSLTLVASVPVIIRY